MRSTILRKINKTRDSLTVRDSSTQCNYGLEHLDSACGEGPSGSQGVHTFRMVDLVHVAQRALEFVKLAGVNGRGPGRWQVRVGTREHKRVNLTMSAGCEYSEYVKSVGLG
jgi:hypothetical protein